jgi:hypothetical protein
MSKGATRSAALQGSHLPSRFESILFMFDGHPAAGAAAVPRAYGRVQKPIPSESGVLRNCNNWTAILGLIRPRAPPRPAAKRRGADALRARQAADDLDRHCRSRRSADDALAAARRYHAAALVLIRKQVHSNSTADREDRSFPNSAVIQTPAES